MLEVAHCGIYFFTNVVDAIGFVLSALSFGVFVLYVLPKLTFLVSIEVITSSTNNGVTRILCQLMMIFVMIIVLLRQCPSRTLNFSY